MNEFGMEQHIEACAIEKKHFSSICIIAIYSAPSGGFKVFMNGLEVSLKKFIKFEL
jgi:hypothetical protein